MTTLKLAEEAWDIHSAFARTPCLVTPSLPILYFGDLEAYQDSPIRIVTVGLNPSKIEFPAHDPLCRFPCARHLARASASILCEQALHDYVGALNAYFRTVPYRKWFDGAYAALLQGMDASFYSDRANTALHTDLCSPLATDPTWSGLDLAQRANLMSRGVPLWHELVEFLEPDVALISVAYAHLSLLRFQSLAAWETIYTVERQNPYQVSGVRVWLRSGKSTLLVFGKAAQLPFGTLGYGARHALGQFVIEEVCS